MSLPILIIGAGGHGRVVADLIRARGGDLKGFLDQDNALHDQQVAGVPVLGNDHLLSTFAPGDVTLANGVGAVASLATRTQLFTRLTAAGYVFDALIHPRSIVSASATVSAGAQVMAGAIVQAGAQISENAIINTGATVDRRVGSHVHVAPGVILCGNVQLGEGCYVGAGSTIIQGVRVGAGAFIAAGSVVVADVAAAARVAGLPAKDMGSR